jgi:hypothetical protein
MVQPGLIFIRRPPRLLISSFASTQTPRCRHVPSVPPRNLRSGFETQTRKPVTDGFEVQTTKPRSRVAYSIRVPRLDRCHRRPRPISMPSPPEPRSTRTSTVLTRSTLSLLCLLRTCRCPSLTSVLHRSRSIDTARFYLTFTSPSTTASELHTCTTRVKRHVAYIAFAMVGLVTTQPTLWITLTITHYKTNTQRYLSTLCSQMKAICQICI